MFIFGHIGFTLTAYAVYKRKEPICLKSALLVSTLALMPDILDRGMYLIIRSYPVPGVFHSALFYAMAIPLTFLFFRIFLSYPIILSGNVILDVVNTDLRAFIYPLYGWTNGLSQEAVYWPLRTFLDDWPRTIGYRIPTNHYLIFEVVGLILIVLVARKMNTASQQLAAEMRFINKKPLSP